MQPRQQRSATRSNKFSYFPMEKHYFCTLCTCFFSCYILCAVVLIRLPLENKRWVSTERKSCFPMSLTSLPPSCDWNKCSKIWRWSINLSKVDAQKTSLGIFEHNPVGQNTLGSFFAWVGPLWSQWNINWSALAIEIAGKSWSSVRGIV